MNLDGVDDATRVRVRLRDTEGVEVASGDTAEGALTVQNVRRWAPEHGYLYDLEVQVARPSGGVQDKYHLNVGFRTVAVDGNRFLINGEPFYFTGFGMHEDHPVIGKGHGDAHMLHDFALLKWIGANSFRTSHYSY